MFNLQSNLPYYWDVKICGHVQQEQEDIARVVLQQINKINGNNPGYYANHISVPSVEHNLRVKIMLCYSILRILTILLLMSSAHLLLQELPGNSPTTVKDDSKSKKNLEQQAHKQRL